MEGSLPFSFHTLKCLITTSWLKISTVLGRYRLSRSDYFFWLRLWTCLLQSMKTSNLTTLGDTTWKWQQQRGPPGRCSINHEFFFNISFGLTTTSRIRSYKQATTTTNHRVFGMCIQETGRRVSHSSISCLLRWNTQGKWSCLWKWRTDKSEAVTQWQVCWAVV